MSGLEPDEGKDWPDWSSRSVEMFVLEGKDIHFVIMWVEVCAI
jgi:hypothetical protein